MFHAGLIGQEDAGDHDRSASKDGGTETFIEQQRAQKNGTDRYQVDEAAALVVPMREIASEYQVKAAAVPIR